MKFKFSCLKNLNFTVMFILNNFYLAVDARDVFPN